nr:helix-turn-helix transcriptional regulator [uncultured Draconibacterium sp.]
MNPLSKREMQVADLVHQGYIDKEIANQLNISYETVRTHTKNIRRKLNARHAVDITRIFITKLKENAIQIILAIAATYLIHKHPEIIDTIKTSLVHHLKISFK